MLTTPPFFAATPLDYFSCCRHTPIDALIPPYATLMLISMSPLRAARQMPLLLLTLLLADAALPRYTLRLSVAR